MRFSMVNLAVAAFLPGLAIGDNTVTFINNCPYDIYYWTVGPAGSNVPGSTDNERTAVPAHGSLGYTMPDGVALGGGSVMKIRDLPRYQVGPAGILQFEHNLELNKPNGKLWYDLSIIDCDPAVGPEHPMFCPLIGGGVEMSVRNKGEGVCNHAVCTVSGGCTSSTYDRHGHWPGEPSFSCRVGADVVLETCKERAGPRTKGDPTIDGLPPPVMDPKPSPALPKPSSPLSEPSPPLPKPQPSGPLTLTTDGTCGGTTGFMCEGSIFGNCCSKWGFCGNSLEHCDAGCQLGFGSCSGFKYQEPKLSPALPSGFKTSIIKAHGPESLSTKTAPISTPIPSPAATISTTEDVKFPPVSLPPASSTNVNAATSKHGDYQPIPSSTLKTVTLKYEYAPPTPAPEYSPPAEEPVLETPKFDEAIPVPSQYASPPVKDPALEAPVDNDNAPAPPPYSSPPANKPEGEISPNGVCGVGSGFNCAGSRFGNCCSEWNFCGNGPAYCSGACQSGFGNCDDGKQEDLAPKPDAHVDEHTEVEAVPDDDARKESRPSQDDHDLEVSRPSPDNEHDVSAIKSETPEPEETASKPDCPDEEHKELDPGHEDVDITEELPKPEPEPEQSDWKPDHQDDEHTNLEFSHDDDEDIEAKPTSPVDNHDYAAPEYDEGDSPPDNDAPSSEINGYNGPPPCHEVERRDGDDDMEAAVPLAHQDNLPVQVSAPSPPQLPKAAVTAPRIVTKTRVRRSRADRLAALSQQPEQLEPAFRSNTESSDFF